MAQWLGCLPGGKGWEAYDITTIKRFTRSKPVFQLKYEFLFP